MLAPTVAPFPLNNSRAFVRFYHSGRSDHRIGPGNPAYVNRYTFRLKGFILGCLIIFFAAALFSIEVARVYTGSINRGQNDSNTSFQYLINPDVIIGFNARYTNNRLENRWVWPWSTATLLFSLILFTTGAFGIYSGVRQSYSAVLIFFISLVLSLCLMVFLIITYATILAGWKELYGTSQDTMPSFVRMDKNLSSACLAISCVLTLLLFISLIISGTKIRVCTEKNYPTPIRGYQRLPTMFTPEPRRARAPHGSPASRRGSPAARRGRPR